MDVLAAGLGPVLVARMDGADVTVDDLAQLLDYIESLLDRWSPWSSDAARVAALTPDAFSAFTEGRFVYEEEDSEEDDE